MVSTISGMRRRPDDRRRGLRAHEPPGIARLSIECAKSPFGACASRLLREGFVVHELAHLRQGTLEYRHVLAIKPCGGRDPHLV